VICFLLIAWLLSENRRGIQRRVVIGGLALQIVLALILLKFPPAIAAVSVLATAVSKLDEATGVGTAFVFGYLGGAPLPFTPVAGASSLVLAFRVFPLILVICALASLLLYWGVLQAVVRAFAFVLRRSLGLGGALGLGAAVNVFVGMVEAPLLIRPYLATMARGELFALMTCGMAWIAGTVMAIYGHILSSVIPRAFDQILIAALISAPGAIAVAGIMVPFEAHEKEQDYAQIVIEDAPANAMEAIARGVADGVVILANVLAFLIVALALVALLDMALGALPWVAGEPLSLQRIFGIVLRPAAFLAGVDQADLGPASRLLGVKAVLNEFVAYTEFANLPASQMSAHSRIILTYCLCGFANFGSVGIMVGGMSTMAPKRRGEIASLGLKAMLAGTIASLLSGAIVGAIV
jgi:CNT family concentrative nucleoside transporter